MQAMHASSHYVNSCAINTDSHLTGSILTAIVRLIMKFCYWGSFGARFLNDFELRFKSYCCHVDCRRALWNRNIQLISVLDYGLYSFPIATAHISGVDRYPLGWLWWLFSNMGIWSELHFLSENWIYLFPQPFTKMPRLKKYYQGIAMACESCLRAFLIVDTLRTGYFGVVSKWMCFPQLWNSRYVSRYAYWRATTFLLTAGVSIINGRKISEFIKQSHTAHNLNTCISSSIQNELHPTSHIYDFHCLPFSTSNSPNTRPRHIEANTVDHGTTQKS